MSYSTFSDSCGVIPDEIPDPEVFPGGNVTGNVCWSVLASHAGGLIAYDDPLIFGAPRYYFRLYSWEIAQADGE